MSSQTALVPAVCCYFLPFPFTLAGIGKRERERETEIGTKKGEKETENGIVKWTDRQTDGVRDEN